MKRRVVRVVRRSPGPGSLRPFGGLADDACQRPGWLR
jgi:hypothetical protein